VTHTVAEKVRVLPFGALNPETQQAVDHVQTTGRPVVITRDGEGAAVVVPAAEYELQLRRLALLERIAGGERDFAEGRTYSQEEVEVLMDEWLADER
jgi:prevent-host-death family protein